MSPREFADAVRDGTLKPGQTCITLDDALLCQHDIAAPVMEELGFLGFFFIYTSVLGDDPDPLEFYRDFRNTWFGDMEDFYAAFFGRVTVQFPTLHQTYLRSFPSDYLSQFRFYTENDRRFRFFRDHVAGPELYCEIMDSAGYDRQTQARKLFM